MLETHPLLRGTYSNINSLFLCDLVSGGVAEADVEGGAGVTLSDPVGGADQILKVLWQEAQVT